MAHRLVCPADFPRMKTYSPKPEHIVRRWYVIDASGQVLGRLASEVAAILRGKHKPIFAPHMDTGDNVIVVNASQIELTGGKESKKISYRHSGFPGGIKGTRYDALLANKPSLVIEKAVRGMLPKNSLGRSMIKKLHVVAGAEHRHQAQQPVPYTLGEPPIWEGLPERRPRPTKRSTTPPTPERPAAKKPAATPRTKPTTAAKSKDKAPAKRSAAKKPSARKPTTSATRSSAKKTTARKTTARKSTAQKDQEES
jgi:large subunit ribosomal protein L13